ncbi:hypothetical protein BDD12DRAFT_817673 [Trichophaea hybrida]|nr:hypothetical protein BDD12DRAFT_817673 [Trichophaea hybrida]
MAPDLKGAKKRKATPAASPQAKKSKTTKAAKKAAPTPAPAPRRAAPRKTASDFYSDPESDPESDTEDGGWDKLQDKDANGKKKSKKPAIAKKDATKPTVKKAAEPEVVLEPESEPEGEAEISLNVDGPDTSEDEEADDQTATLLQGFESSDDEDDIKNEKGIDPKALAKAGMPDEKKVKKKLEKLSGREKTTPGIIYLGRIPHGFYEHEMRAYFSQFGTVTRLRLSRNKKTGHSKHYAFLEFSDEDVAQIVADTMNNYLLFGHILKCKVVPRDNIEYVESLFKGANKRFKARPGAKLAKALLEKKKTEEVWANKLDAENRRRKKINTRLKAKGIDYEFEAPEAKKADKVIAPVAETLAIEEKAPEAVAEEPAVGEKVVAKKGKKAAKKALEKPAEEQPAETLLVEAKEVEEPKAAAKKRKKKAAKKEAEKIVEEQETPAVEEKEAEKPKAEKKKGKKATKKTAEAEVTAEEPVAEKKSEKKSEKKKKGAAKKVVEKKVVEIETIVAAPVDNDEADVEVEVEEETTVAERSPTVKKKSKKTKGAVKA